jgi:hypothetical protein
MMEQKQEYVDGAATERHSRTVPHQAAPGGHDRKCAEVKLFFQARPLAWCRQVDPNGSALSNETQRQGGNCKGISDV